MGMGLPQGAWSREMQKMEGLGGGGGGRGGRPPSQKAHLLAAGWSKDPERPEAGGPRPSRQCGRPGGAPAFFPSGRQEAPPRSDRDVRAMRLLLGLEGRGAPVREAARARRGRQARRTALPATAPRSTQLCDTATVRSGRAPPCPHARMELLCCEGTRPTRPGRADHRC